MILTIVIVAVIVAMVVWAIATYNSLVALRNRVEEAWAQIDVQLRLRYDLIPNLVETVKGYASHERETLDAVVRARQSAVDASGGVEGQAAAENVLTGALRQLFALSEAYPDLKANTNFADLQDKLSGVEAKIAYARQFYNDTVRRINDKIQKFPSLMIAGAMNLEKREYFEVEGDARGPVSVQF
ncbi:MAG: LemA family protein [Acidimicrobiales bacterium]